jgi:hypothetical protein
MKKDVEKMNCHYAILIVENGIYIQEAATLSRGANRKADLLHW